MLAPPRNRDRRTSVRSSFELGLITSPSNWILHRRFGDRQIATRSPSFLRRWALPNAAPWMDQGFGNCFWNCRNRPQSSVWCLLAAKTVFSKSMFPAIENRNEEHTGAPLRAHPDKQPSSTCSFRENACAPCTLQRERLSAK